MKITEEHRQRFAELTRILMRETQKPLPFPWREGPMDKAFEEGLPKEDGVFERTQLLLADEERTLGIALEAASLLGENSLRELANVCLQRAANAASLRDACTCKSNCPCKIHSRENGREP